MGSSLETSSFFEVMRSSPVHQLASSSSRGEISCQICTHKQTRPSVWQLRKLSGGLTRFPLDEEKNGLINICPSKNAAKSPHTQKCVCVCEIGTKTPKTSTTTAGFNNGMSKRRTKAKKSSQFFNRNLFCIAEKKYPVVVVVAAAATLLLQPSFYL